MFVYTDEQLMDMADRYSNGIPPEDYSGNGIFGPAAWVLDVFTFEELSYLANYMHGVGVEDAGQYKECGGMVEKRDHSRARNLTSEELARKLRDHAAAEGVTELQIIQAALEAYLADREVRVHKS